MARDAADEFESGDSMKADVRDLGQYLFGTPEKTRLAGNFLKRVATVFGNREEYAPDHLFANVIFFCDVDHWRTHYKQENMVDGPPRLVEIKTSWFDEDHKISVEKSDLAGCAGTFATNAAFSVNLVSMPGKSYIQFCPWYLRKIKASPYPGSWAIKNWQMFLNGARAVIQHRLGGRSPIDLAARIEHLILHELTHNRLVIPPCYDQETCTEDKMPDSVSRGGGSLDIGKGFIFGDKLKPYFWKNCVQKANNLGYGNGVYNADSLAFAALGVKMINNGLRVERSGKLTHIASAMARIRRFLGL